MRVVIQRVSRAEVSICGDHSSESKQYTPYSSIDQGLMILVGIESNDTAEDAEWLVRKILGLRIFDDKDGVMNLSVMDVNGGILVVSQFTLMASYKKGNRPSWFRAAPHGISIPLYEKFCSLLSEGLGHPVSTGIFGADMRVSLVNDGPVTICMDTHNKE
ncbi:MAG: D-aminoacyl-tRNA deacylase [Candidatus Cryptobacteroides sp.]